MSIENARLQIAAARAALDAADTELLAPPPATKTVVNAGDDLKAALRIGLPVEVASGTFEGVYELPAGTQLKFAAGTGVRATGGAGPALYVKPGTKGVSVIGGVFSSDHSDSVIQIGENTSNQTHLEDQPEDILLQAMFVPQHRGKRAFSLHAYKVNMIDCVAPDTWSSRDADSQAVYILNSRGEIIVSHCILGAGSEIILVGGDTSRTPGMNPTGLTFQNNTLIRPLTWMTDADSTKRRIKNIFELKAGINVNFSNNFCSGNWSDPRTTQGGYAVVLTPALDGSASNPPKASGVVNNVTIEGNTFVNVSAGVNILGRHYSSYTTPRLELVDISRNRWRIDKTTFGGFGQFMKIGAEPGTIIVEENLILQNGSSHVVSYKGTVMNPDGTTRAGGLIGDLQYVRNTSQLSSYGFNLDGHANTDVAWAALQMEAWLVEDNKFMGTSRSGIAGGQTMIPQASFDALPEVVALRNLTA